MRYPEKIEPDQQRINSNRLIRNAMKVSLLVGAIAVGRDIILESSIDNIILDLTILTLLLSGIIGLYHLGEDYINRQE